MAIPLCGITKATESLSVLSFISNLILYEERKIFEVSKVPRKGCTLCSHITSDWRFRNLEDLVSLCTLTECKNIPNHSYG